MPAYAAKDDPAAFTTSRNLFESLITTLTSTNTTELTHTQLEELLTEQSRELTRTLLQDHLDLRTLREQDHTPPPTGAEGIKRTRTERGHTRTLTTLFGTVTTTRTAYRAPGAPNLHPADATLNLPPGKHSHGLRRLVALEAARGSFEHAQEAITRTTGTHPGKRQIQQLATAAATDIDAFYHQGGPIPTTGDQDLLVLTFDGKGVVMRPEALRTATAQAAQSTTKLATRISPGEKPHRKRMAEVACVYDATPAIRTPGDIITPPTSKDTTHTRPRPGPCADNKWATASLIDDLDQVIAAGFDQAQRRDPGHRRTWVVLVDGNRPQLRAIADQAHQHGVRVHVVLDFVHVLEYLWKAAWSFFEPADPDAEAWVGAQATKVLQGRARQVAAGIRRRATTFGYSARERAGADKCAGYLVANAQYLDYATALEQGWPIATGVIEGACRHLVKDRMDITGARWGLEGAEAVLKLRALIATGDFAEYWAFHLRREFDRNHRVRYRDEVDLAA